jgi:NAD(P)-dependent dehydrogenase (short-subunit alcohol dehydrogenase family)
MLCANMTPGNQRVALVTGAGSGIGRCVSLRLAGAGYAVALVGRRAEALRQTVSLMAPGAEAIALVADVADAAGCAESVDRCVARYGRLDVLVNNAGAAPLASIDRTTPELLEACFRMNALGPAMMIARAWPRFAAQRSGCVVNISSMATADPFPGFFAYAAAKAGVNLMAKSCAKEGRAIGVRAFAVAPGAVETAMLRANFGERAIPAGRCLAPDDVARVVMECIDGAHDDRNGDTIFVPSP